MAYSSNRTTSNARIYQDSSNLRLDNRLSSDKKPVKIGDDVTGLLLADNEVFVEKSPTQEDHIANKKYVDSFTYQFINCGYYGSATGNFIPINGYVIEKTSTSSSNEFVAFVAPYNGSVHKVMWRTEIAQNGDTIFGIHESADGTEVPALGAVGSKTTAINIADDTSQIVDFDSMTSGSNVITKGRIYAIKLTTPSGPQDTNAVLVFKWDITS